MFGCEVWKLVIIFYHDLLNLALLSNGLLGMALVKSVTAIVTCVYNYHLGIKALIIFYTQYHHHLYSVMRLRVLFLLKMKLSSILSERKKAMT